jgi:transcription elongation factor Elf1
MVKADKVPVVVIITNGNFLHQPQWRKKYKINNPNEVIFKCVETQEEVDLLSAEEIQARIEEAFVYDDYKWQLDNKIEIKTKKRAQNIHKILYQCPHCKKEFFMNSKDTKVWCENCGKEWKMNYYGQLHCLNGEDVFTHVPDWYRWERQNVKEEVRSCNYYFEDKIRLEELINSKVKFLDKGTINLVHDYNGFTLQGIVDGKEFYLNKPIESMASVHIEYDFKKRGDAIDIATMEDTWFVYTITHPNPLTKLNFAVEELHKFKKENIEEFNKIFKKKEEFDENKKN